MANSFIAQCINVVCAEYLISNNVEVPVFSSLNCDGTEAVSYTHLKEENVEAMLAGCENLAKHIDTVQQFGLPYIVAINEFATEMCIRDRCRTFLY